MGMVTSSQHEQTFSAWIRRLATAYRKKIGWEVTFSLRRTAECKGIGRVCFTFSPRHPGTLGWLFVFVWFLFAFLVADGTQGFCLSLQVLFTYKRICDRQGFVLDRLWCQKKCNEGRCPVSQSINQDTTFLKERWKNTTDTIHARPPFL